MQLANMFYLGLSRLHVDRKGGSERMYFDDRFGWCGKVGFIRYLFSKISAKEMFISQNVDFTFLSANGARKFSGSSEDFSSGKLQFVRLTEDIDENLPEREKKNSLHNQSIVIHFDSSRLNQYIYILCGYRFSQIWMLFVGHKVLLDKKVFFWTQKTPIKILRNHDDYKITENVLFFCRVLTPCSPQTVWGNKKKVLSLSCYFRFFLWRRITSSWIVSHNWRGGGVRAPDGYSLWSMFSPWSGYDFDCWCRYGRNFCRKGEYSDHDDIDSKSSGSMIFFVWEICDTREYRNERFWYYINEMHESPLWVQLRDCLTPVDVLVLLFCILLVHVKWIKNVRDICRFVALSHDKKWWRKFISCHSSKALQFGLWLSSEFLPW